MQDDEIRTDDINSMTSDEKDLRVPVFIQRSLSARRSFGTVFHRISSVEHKQIWKRLLAPLDRNTKWSCIITVGLGVYRR